MKKFVSIFMAAAAFAPVVAQSVESQMIERAYITSISDNGQWVIGQSDSEGYLFIKDLVNDLTYTAGGNTGIDGTGYVSALGKTIANDGTAIALVNGLPFYWTPKGTRGTWTQLPGEAADGSAILGSISADGSTIIGSIGASGLSMEERLVTNPCIWQRKAGGSYSDPVYLPKPSRDIFGDVPQYLNLISMSADGSVIAATMTSGSGFFEIPYLYTKGENGEWTYSAVGEKLIIPEGVDVVRMPGDFNLMQPNPWDYLNDEEGNAFWAAFPSWLQRPEIASLPLDKQTLEQLKYMAEFMHGDNKTEYLSLLNEYLEGMEKFNAQLEAYYKFREILLLEGMNFVMNNAFVSPDGKMACFTGEKILIIDPTLGEDGMVKFHLPVAYNVETGEITEYMGDRSRAVTSLTADYSIICRNIGPDQFWPDGGWIFPGAGETGMSLSRYLLANASEDAYDWAEENMYREVISGYTEDGQFEYSDSWTIGYPVFTPDMSVMASANSTMYWADSYYSSEFSFISFVLETGIKVEAPAVGPGQSGIGEVTDSSVISTEIYDLSGRKVNASNAAGGIYIVRETKADGTAASRKVVIK